MLGRPPPPPVRALNMYVLKDQGACKNIGSTGTHARTHTHALREGELPLVCGSVSKGLISDNLILFKCSALLRTCRKPRKEKGCLCWSQF